MNMFTYSISHSLFRLQNKHTFLDIASGEGLIAAAGNKVFFPPSPPFSSPIIQCSLLIFQLGTHFYIYLVQFYYEGFIKMLLLGVPYGDVPVLYTSAGYIFIKCYNSPICR